MKRVTLDELLSEVRAIQTPPARIVRKLIVASDVFEALRAGVPSALARVGAFDNLSPSSFDIFENKYLEPGTVIPCDQNGAPITPKDPT